MHTYNMLHAIGNTMLGGYNGGVLAKYKSIFCKKILGKNPTSKVPMIHKITPFVIIFFLSVACCVLIRISLWQVCTFLQKFIQRCKGCD